MKFQVTIQDIFECDLERAFKTPMLIQKKTYVTLKKHLV